MNNMTCSLNSSLITCSLNSSLITCGICLEECRAFPVIPIHQIIKDQRSPVCRQIYCEDCFAIWFSRYHTCPMCRYTVESYMIQAFKVPDLSASVNCPHCDWQGTRLVYNCCHLMVHFTNENNVLIPR